MLGGELFDGLAVAVKVELAGAVGLEELLQVGIVARINAGALAADAVEDALELFGVFGFLGLGGLAALGVGELFADVGDALFDFDLRQAGSGAFVAGAGDGALALFGPGQVLVALFEPGNAGLLLAPRLGRCCG